MTVSDYQANQILQSVGIDKLRQATFEGEFAELILHDIEDAFELYDSSALRVPLIALSEYRSFTLRDFS